MIFRIPCFVDIFVHKNGSRIMVFLYFEYPLINIIFTVNSINNLVVLIDIDHFKYSLIVLIVF